MKNFAQTQIMIVDDDPVSRELIAGYLQADNFQVTEAGDGNEMLQKLAEQPIDLVLLDVNLPGKDGFTLVREIRSTLDIGIIMLTQRQDDIDRIVGLELGADDYITKPFNPREVVARVRTVLRRIRHVNQVNDISPYIRFQDWALHIGGRYLLSPQNEEIHLSGGEFMLLSAFLQKPNVLFSRERLATLIDPQSKAVSRSIDVLIARLRKKLGDDAQEPKLIVTIYGAGYIFTAETY